MDRATFLKIMVIAGLLTLAASAYAANTLK